MNTAFNVILVSLTALLATLFLSAVLAYPAMLLFGAVHSFLPVIPAFGWWQTVLVISLIQFLHPVSTSTTSK